MMGNIIHSCSKPPNGKWWTCSIKWKWALGSTCEFPRNIFGGPPNFDKAPARTQKSPRNLPTSIWGEAPGPPLLPVPLGHWSSHPAPAVCELRRRHRRSFWSLCLLLSRRKKTHLRSCVICLIIVFGLPYFGKTFRCSIDDCVICTSILVWYGHISNINMHTVTYWNPRTLVLRYVNCCRCSSLQRIFQLLWPMLIALFDMGTCFCSNKTTNRNFLVNLEKNKRT